MALRAAGSSTWMAGPRFLRSFPPASERHDQQRAAILAIGKSTESNADGGLAAHGFDGWKS
jgi:hypothetical protein